MDAWKRWTIVDEIYARDYRQRVDAMTPEPLFESFLLPRPKICLRCAQERATSILYSPQGMQPVLPLCSRCAADWNFSGYAILKGVTPKTLIWRLLQFKLRHPLSRPSIVDIYDDVKHLLRWVRKMGRLKNSES